jgi:hypothetical protein
MKLAWMRQTQTAPPASPAALRKMQAVPRNPRLAWLWTDLALVINKAIHKKRE